VQTCTTKFPPVQTHYTPDGKTLLYITTSQHILDLKLSKDESEPKETWKVVPVDRVRPACCARHADAEAVTHRKQSSKRQILRLAMTEGTLFLRPTHM
jgi:THO complex subunit 3